jgi:hypothetical protein
MISIQLGPIGVHMGLSGTVVELYARCHTGIGCDCVPGAGTSD